MRASLAPFRGLALAAGLVLPLAAGTASAQERSWVDPPAKPASGAAKAAGAARIGDDAKAGTPAAPASASAPSPGPAAARTGMAEGTALAADETPRRRFRPARRLAETPAADPTTGEGTTERAGAARALAVAYLASVSASGDAMVGAAPRFYGPRIRFYGRPTTLAALIAEKRGFVRRWPERRYAARTVRTACTRGGETCVVRAIIDFRAASPQRGAVSRGSSELVLEMSFSGASPVITAETGRVLRRGGGEQADALAPAGGRA